jgi:tetratricopeptide (TPR) repeat protein
MTLRNLGKLNLQNKVLLIICASISFIIAVNFHTNYKRPEIIVSKQASAVNINTIFLRLLSFGNKRLIADTLWIQTLLESDLEFYKGDPFNNWMYLRFSSIAELDPKFYENYLWGGQYLSIIKDDLEGAADIMNRGLAKFPDDYRLNFNQGFNYYFEMENIEKAIPYLERVENHPSAPRFITSLLIKLKHESGADPLLTIAIIKEAYDKTEDQTLKNKLAKDLYALKAEIDLNCLNQHKPNCDLKDAHGEYYVLNNGTYHAVTPYSPYKIHYRRKGD